MHSIYNKLIINKEQYHFVQFCASNLALKIYKNCNLQYLF
jgi:hypothetical protein